MGDLNDKVNKILSEPSKHENLISKYTKKDFSVFIPAAQKALENEKLREETGDWLKSLKPLPAPMSAEELRLAFEEIIETQEATTDRILKAQAEIAEQARLATESNARTNRRFNIVIIIITFLTLIATAAGVIVSLLQG